MAKRSRAGDDSDDEYTLTGYGEMSTEGAFTLPPSPTQTIKYRYRAYRPKLARLARKKNRTTANGTPLKTKSSAYHTSVSARPFDVRRSAFGVSVFSGGVCG